MEGPQSQTLRLRSSSLPLLGVKIIFRVGLVLLKCMLGTREKLKACQGQYETMELLRAIEPRYMQEGFLVREVKKRARAPSTDCIPNLFSGVVYVIGLILTQCGV